MDSKTAYTSLPTHNDQEARPSHEAKKPKLQKRTALLIVASVGMVLMLARLSGPLASSPAAWRAGLKSASGSFKHGCGMATKVKATPLAGGGHHALPSGDKIPGIALGTWKAEPGEVGKAVTVALKEGYRHIDGAWIYRNEPEVGKALKESGVAREDLWLTSKLWNTFHHPDDVEAALDETLSSLGTSYLDLYLMHWPVAFKKGTSDVDYDLTENPFPTWQKLEELVEKGKIRNIGVSNFNIRRISNLTANPTIKIKPSINQVELNWFNPQPELVAWSATNGVLLEAYSPFGSNDQVKASLDVKEVKEISADMGISGAQVLVSWLAQRGAVVLPKSVTPSRIKENLQVFKLSDEDFEKLEKSATSHKPKRVVQPWWGGVDIFEDEK